MPKLGQYSSAMMQHSVIELFLNTFLNKCYLGGFYLLPSICVCKMIMDG